MVKGVTNSHLGPIWYLSEHSDVSCAPNQFLGWDFFAVSYITLAIDTYLVGQSFFQHNEVTFVSNIEKFRCILENKFIYYIKLYNIYFMKNMTSNLALIVVLHLLFCKTSVHHLCIYTYICSLSTPSSVPKQVQNPLFQYQTSDFCY